MVVHSEVVTKQGDSKYAVSMVEAVEEIKQDVLPEKSTKTKYILDSGYASEANLEKLAEQDIYLPDRDYTHEKIGGKVKPENRAEMRAEKEEAIETAHRFEYDANTNSFTCPQNNKLYFKREKEMKGVRYSEFTAKGCNKCPIRSSCIGVKKIRKKLWIRTSDLADMKIKLVAQYGKRRIKSPNKNPLTLAMREKLSNPEGRKIYSKRFHSIEGCFGVIKNARQGWQFLRRGLEKVQVDWAERLIAHNLAKLIGFRRNFEWQPT